MITAFSPAPEHIDSILVSLCDPERSVASVAGENQTSVAALCIWLSLPEIALLLESMAASFARRVRLIASNQMELVAEAARMIVQGFVRDEAAHAGRPADPAAIARHTAARRVCMSAMKTLQQLASFGLQPVRRPAVTSHNPPTILPEADRADRRSGTGRAGPRGIGGPHAGN
ncbi:MAG: hypothetical protein J0L78_04730 [Planctomycetes bacterium]|nr:hypothetical protein [Planctomycetota bacterium]